MNSRRWKHLGPSLGFALFLIALWVLRRELHAYHFHEIVASVGSLPLPHILLAFALTALNYLTLTGYDALAFRYIQHPLPYRRIALASFLGYAFRQGTRPEGLWSMSSWRVRRTRPFTRP